MKNETNTQQVGKTSQHTPAPWIWNDNGTHSELMQTISGEDSILYHGADWKMKPADKELIANAPSLLKENEQLKEDLDDVSILLDRQRMLNAELLEALKRTLNAHRKLHASLTVKQQAKYIEFEYQPSVIKALTAIAKAESKTLVGS